MCGIFAYSGSRDVKNVLIDGLKKLEYRGYDSSGVAFFKDKQIQCFKSSGDLSHLETLLTQKKSNGQLGIGHTRWATHGAPTQKNSHPHSSGSIYVIHNGIIENEIEIKKKFDLNPVNSETDSECIASLISYFYKKESQFIQSVFKSLEYLKGSYAVVVLCEESPNEMIGFTNGPPLLLCKGTKELYISSDPYVSSEYASQMIPLEAGEVVHIEGQNFKILDQKGKTVKKSFIALDKKESLSEKRGFPHFMLKEIFEQPTVMSSLLKRHIDRSHYKLKFELSRGSKSLFDQDIEKSSSLLIVACGSSYYVALFAKYIIEELSSLKVEVEFASEFIYRKSFLSQDTLALFISQSGETADTLIAFKKVKESKLKTISICNVKNSSLERTSDYFIDIEAGTEVGVASTKSFTASLLVLYLLSLHLGKIKKTKDLLEEEKLKNLLSLPFFMEQILRTDSFFEKQAKKFKSFSGFLFLGRNLYYPIALEGALKLKEITYFTAEAYPSGEMKHGPLALVSKERAVVALMPSQGLFYKKTLINLKEAHSRGAYCFIIGGDEEAKSFCDHLVPLPKTDRVTQALLTVIPLQLMSYFIAKDLGHNPDRPRNLAKSVTVE